jgi:hypothetical protein
LIIINAFIPSLLLKILCARIDSFLSSDVSDKNGN